jgi:hypothetical protein
LVYSGQGFDLDRTLVATRGHPGGAWRATNRRDSAIIELLHRTINPAAHFGEALLSLVGVRRDCSTRKHNVAMRGTAFFCRACLRQCDGFNTFSGAAARIDLVLNAVVSFVSADDGGNS